MLKCHLDLERLQVEQYLALNKAVEIANSFEQAKNNSELMSGNMHTGNISTGYDGQGSRFERKKNT